MRTGDALSGVCGWCTRELKHMRYYIVERGQTEKRKTPRRTVKIEEASNHFMRYRTSKHAFQNLQHMNLSTQDTYYIVMPKKLIKFISTVFVVALRRRLGFFSVNRVRAMQDRASARVDKCDARILCFLFVLFFFIIFR